MRKGRFGVVIATLGCLACCGVANADPAAPTTGDTASACAGLTAMVEGGKTLTTEQLQELLTCMPTTSGSGGPPPPMWINPTLAIQPPMSIAPLLSVAPPADSYTILNRSAGAAF